MIWRTLGLLAILLLLSGCGQKGPLYLPKEPAAQTQPADH